MKQLLEKIDAKVITSVGGIVLAGFLSYTIYKILTNDLTHIETAIQAQTEVQKESNVVIRDITRVVEGNTRILQNLDTKISTLR